MQEHRATARCAAATLPMLFNVRRRRRGGSSTALDELCATAAAVGRGGRDDRWSSPTAGWTSEHAPIPSLLATGAVHHHLIRRGMRTRCGIVVETGEPREVHALLRC